MVTENDIRPEKLMQKQKELYQLDVEEFVSKKDQFVKVNCPACFGIEYRHFLTKYTLDYAECTNCGTVYMNPKPTLQIMADYYEKSRNYVYWNEVVFPATENIRREKIFKPRVQLLLDLKDKYNFQTNKLVEVGPGYGIFCEELKKQSVFKSILAVEPTPALAETCRLKGIDVIQKPIEDVCFGLNADVIVSFEVIEHLFSPKEFLETCHKNLNSNGFLIVTCPNIEGFDVAVLKENSDIIDTEHVNYFSVSSLSKLLEYIGFEVIECSTPGELDVDIVRNKLNSEAVELDIDNFFRKIVMNKSIGDNFQKFLKENRLSSNMIIVSKKIAK